MNKLILKKIKLIKKSMSDIRWTLGEIADLLNEEKKEEPKASL